MRRSNQSTLKEINPECLLKDWCWSWSSNTLATWCKELTHGKKTLLLEKIKHRRRRGWQRMQWLDSIIDSIDMSLSILQETVEDREACSPWIAESKTQLSEWMNNNIDQNTFMRITYYNEEAEVTPKKDKVKNSCSETKWPNSLYLHEPLPQPRRAQCQERWLRLATSPSGEKRECNVSPTSQNYRVLPKVLDSLSAYSECWWARTVYMLAGSYKQRKAGMALCNWKEACILRLPFLQWRRGSTRNMCSIYNFQSAAQETSFYLSSLEALTEPAYFACLANAENDGKWQSSEHSWLISFRMNWLDLLAV